MTDRELAEIVAGLRSVGSDHADVEAKAAESELPKQLWHTLSAFANTPGGGERCSLGYACFAAKAPWSSSARFALRRSR
jgi:hypothetical protein